MTANTPKMKEFVHSFDNDKSKCHIRILNEPNKKAVIMCSQFCDNGEGASITNMVEYIVTDIKNYLEQTEKDDFIWIEHYGKNIGIEKNGSYAIVSFENDTWLPSWNKFISIADVAESTGYDKKYFETPNEVKCK